MHYLHYFVVSCTVLIRIVYLLGNLCVQCDLFHCGGGGLGGGSLSFVVACWH